MDIKKERNVSRKAMKVHRYFTFFVMLLLIGAISACSGGNGEKKTNSSITAAAEAGLKPFSDWNENTNEAAQEAPLLKVHYLDVGQGLSVLCESNGRYMLYDGGDRDNTSFVISYLKKQGVEKLDYVIASHYDADHLNGIIGALNVYDADTIIGPDYVNNSKLYQSFISKINELGQTVVHPAPKQEYSFGLCKFEILSPSEITEDSNNNSVAIKLYCGDTAFIFTGDAEQSSERDMIRTGINLSCNVLQIGHHGSASSTSWDFLQRTVPEYAVISCGRGNKYGHPDEDTMDKLENSDIKIFRTDEQGTIIAQSDGTEITWNKEPTQNFNSGDSGEGIVIKKSELSEEAVPSAAEPQAEKNHYILNTNSKKFHYPDCSTVKRIQAENYEEYDGTREDIISKGYSACGICKP